MELITANPSLFNQERENLEGHDDSKLQGGFFFQIYVHIDPNGEKAYFTCQACCGMTYIEEHIMGHIETHKKEVKSKPNPEQQNNLTQNEIPTIVVEQRRTGLRKRNKGDASVCEPSIGNNYTEELAVQKGIIKVRPTRKLKKRKKIKRAETGFSKLVLKHTTLKIRLNKHKKAKRRHLIQELFVSDGEADTAEDCEEFVEHENLFNDNEVIKPTYTDKQNIEFPCPHCDEKFKERKLLRVHKKNIHDGEKEKFPCPTCGKFFKKKSHLEGHIRSHSGIKPHKCSICEQFFSQRRTLDEHKRTHAGIKPYQCSICEQFFSQRRTLAEHVRTHTGVKPYQCEHCGVAFRTSSGLRKHIRVHTGEAPYCCTTCGRRFKAFGGLSRHMATHSGERSHLCDTCGKSFTQRCNLKIHQRIHTGVKPHNCNLCGLRFRVKCSLTEHLKKAHGIAEELLTTEEQITKRGRGTGGQPHLHNEIKKKSCNVDAEQLTRTQGVAGLEPNWEAGLPSGTNEYDERVGAAHRPQYFFTPFVLQ